MGYPYGKRYIDMGSGIGVTAFGIADDEWQKAVCEQVSLVQHMSNLYYTEPCAVLAKMLCEKTWSQMAKSWYQILNIFQSLSPFISYIFLGV